MITSYSNKYYLFLKERMCDYDISHILNGDPFAKVLVYILNKKPVGLISYSVIYERIELNYIWVDLPYRQKGIASKLLEHVFSCHDIINITLEVNVNNIKAINLYKKHNFRIVSIRKKYYGKDDAYLMIREMM